MAAYTVFLSSTFADFGKERRKIMENLTYIDVHVRCAELTGDVNKSLTHTLLEMIDGSDMVVLLTRFARGLPFRYRGDVDTKGNRTRL